MEIKKEMIQKYGKKQTEEIINNSLNVNTNVNTKKSNTNLHNTEQITDQVTQTAKKSIMNKYSPYYAAAHGIKSRATGSVNIGLGGVKK